MSSPIDQALTLLNAGELVGIPTETVYGLAADASNPAAVAKIFALKGRPADHPVIVHIAGSEQLNDWACDIPDAAWKLAEAFWPGPLTLILKRQPHVPNAVTGGQDTVGLRAPSHPIAHQLLKRFGGGLAAPSANQFGHVSPTTAQHVIDEFGTDLQLVLDGGPCDVGVESSIVSLIDGTPKLLRPGGVLRKEIEACLGIELEHHSKASTAGVRASGLLDSHYSPRTMLIIGSLEQLVRTAAEKQQQGQKVVLLHHQQWAGDFANTPHSQLPNDPQQYAQQLYATLRSFDRQGFDALLLEEASQDADWLAIHDRIGRAAHIKIAN